MSQRGFEGHPENHVHDHADFSNKIAPDPQSPEDLVESGDPVALIAKNRASTKQALIYVVAVVIGSILVSSLLAVAARLGGGPLCTPDGAQWLCSPTSQVWWPIAASIVPVAGLVGCGIIMVYKLNHYLRWRPWMGVFWFLVPFTMAWLVYTLGMLAV